jgi:hypothetical protein
MIKVYAEAIIYIVLLIISIYMCLSDNIYITMLPIAFVIGTIGQIIFGKRVMTSFFCGILAIIFRQVRTPSLMIENITETFKIVILVLIGECFGWAIKRVYRLSKKKKNIGKKIKNEKSKCYIISIISLVLGLILSSLFNGNYVTYAISKNSIKNYFSNEYHSSSRFKILSSSYISSFNARYVFYTQDTLSSNGIGKFSVYVRDNFNVQDDYQEQIINNISKKLNEKIEKEYILNDVQVYVKNSEVNELTIYFRKQVDQINKEEIENYSKNIADYLDRISQIDGFEQIEQIKVILESNSNPKDNLATYIFMSGYNDMIQKGQEEAYSYIMRALNIEYFD